ncbi:hypothetical protein [Lentzea sp. NPDC003310]|uniref:hypothetical protein n=1 Tax=Lentzea sp. NPDC003310 TaxID=3154447 RepID=UPI0033A17D28
MGELRWDDVRGWMDPALGNDMPLHDGCVLGEVREAWRAIAELARARGWRTLGPESDGATYHVWPAEGFMVNFFECHDEVVFDVDTRELQGQERLDLLAAFMRELGLEFGLSVALALEGLDPSQNAYLRYEPTSDEFVVKA